MRTTVHDHKLLGYDVDHRGRTIRLQTVFDESVPSEFIDVIFSGVVAYSFTNDTLELGTILFGIDEVSAATLVADNEEMFESGRRFGWPGDWNRSVQEAQEHLQSASIKGFEISASLGLSGWVLAKSVRHEEAPQTKAG